MPSPASERPDRSADSPDPNAHLVPRLRNGGVIVAFRHALAPGTFDPPGFRLGDCSTQRNLDATGRAQARRIGLWFQQHALVPVLVRSSPWCRCVDTARLAFGPDATQVWPALGSPVGTAEQAYPEHQALLRKAAAQRRAEGGLEVWVTHLFVLQDLVGQAVGSGEALLLRGDPRAPQGRNAVQVLGGWRLPG
jgi:phosphohistidine phosphatase SixA